MIRLRGGCKLAALTALCFMSASTFVWASEAGARIAVVIDDLGNQRHAGERAIGLPGPVALAFLPHTPHTSRQAKMAHAAGKEVLLHLPMQAAQSGDDLGPGALILDQTREQFARTLNGSLDSVPYATGINNHMGSLLTRHPGAMAWLMEELKRREDFFFLDSFTTHRSVALQLAREENVPALKRDVFLDRVATLPAIQREFQRVKDLARRRGFAVAIGHPHPTTLEFLERSLPELPAQGFRLSTIGALLPDRALQGIDDWQIYSTSAGH